MATKIYVRVCDEDGAPLTMQAPWLMEHNDVEVLAEFLGEGDQVWSLELDPTIAGDVHLLLRIAGHPPLPFSMQAEPGADSPFCFRKQVPRCASLTRQVVSRGADQSVTVVALQFNLTRQHHEIVLVAGFDYHGGTSYVHFAQTQRDDLYAGVTYFGGTPHPVTRAVFDHSIVTFFDFETGVRRRQIKGQADWHELDAILLGAKAPNNEWPDTEALQRLRSEEDTISIVDVYDHITKVGVDAPRSVHQLHFFSHAWSGGPALVNTFEADQYKDSFCKGVRDPNDKDPRCKDFFEENIPNFPTFCAAFATAAFVKVWGCLKHSLHKYIEPVVDLDDPEEMRPGPRGIPYNSREVAEMIRREAIPFTYLANVIMKVGIGGFGSVPTTGSNYQMVSGHRYMFIDRNKHGKELRWYERNFDMQADEWGYVDFRKLM